MKLLKAITMYTCNAMDAKPPPPIDNGIQEVPISPLMVTLHDRENIIE